MSAALDSRVKLGRVMDLFFSPRPPDMSCSKPGPPARDLLKPPQNFKARTNEPRNGDLWRLSLAFRGNNHLMSFQRKHEFPSSSFVEQGSMSPFSGGRAPKSCQNSSYAQAAGIFQFAGAQVATNVARMLVAASTG